MRIRHVAVRTADPAALRPFYAGTLGLPVVDDSDGFLVAVGRSTLAVRPGADDPTYHLAFAVPGDTQAWTDWLTDRVDIVPDEDGDRVVAYDGLGADALYFRDPTGNVLELLCRSGHDGPVGPDGFRDVAEVGLVVEDVPGVARTVAGALGTGDHEASEEFCYLGDERGALVLAAPGRPWYPTAVGAEPAPATVVVEGPRVAPDLPARYALVGVPP